MKAIDLTGARYGRWTVKAKSNERRCNRRMWQCHCDCGTVRLVAGGNLTAGISKSCGCLNSEVQSAKAINRSYKHGHSSRETLTPEYRSWQSMIARCKYPCIRGYENYGGRGISVCERWRDFSNFLIDMGFKPTPRHTIDRINNDGNYEPGNCKWSTYKEQSQNKRKRRKKSLPLFREVAA